MTDVHKTSVSLTWKAPSEDGGSPITGYAVEYRVEGGFKWVRATDDVDATKYTVKSLQEGNEYEFRVAGVNKAGVGAFTQCAMPVVVKERIGTSTDGQTSTSIAK